MPSPRPSASASAATTLTPHLPGRGRTLSVASAVLPELLGRPALVASALSGQEHLGRLFDYQLLLSTPDDPRISEAMAAGLDIQALVGSELGVRIELEGAGQFLPGQPGGSAFGVGAGERQINALVTAARFVRVQQRRALYALRLQPWLALAERRSDHRIFQHLNVEGILRQVLADYPYPSRLQLSQRYPARDYQVQYGETDLVFVERLMQEWGLYYYFEHEGGAHRLVIVDDPASHPPNPSAAYQRVLFHAGEPKIEREHCSDFQLVERLQSGAWTSSDFDFTRPLASLRQTARQPRPTGHAQLEHYRWPGDFATGHEAREIDPLLAQVRAQRQASPGERASGSGPLRGMLCGHTFSLVGHPRASANADYLILGTRLEISELAESSQSGSHDQQGYHCHCEFDVQPAQAIYRPPQRHPKPHTHGPQTAVVTGPAGQDIHTDAYGRVKLSFHWNRHCSKDENSSCWVRVSQAWAGGELGASHVPRIGQEVIVDFESGDPDRPLVTGRVVNALNLPSWQLPGAQALSGLRSRELGGQGGGAGNAAAGRSNHLILDDTPGQIQAQLKSDHQHSALSLGHIVRIHSNQGRQEGRGQGFELRSDGHGALRAGAGLLISTEARNQAQGHLSDLSETALRLAQAQAQHGQLAELAQAHQAQQGGDQDSVASRLQADHQQIEGRGTASTASTTSHGEFPELSQPHLVLASPAGIHSSTAGSTHAHSAQHHAITSGGHTSVSSAQSLLASAKQAIKLFAYQAGIKLVSAHANIELQALKTNIELLAKLDIKQTANRIEITAKEEVVINGGGSYVRWGAAGIEEGTHGGWVAHAASHSLSGPANAPVSVAVPDVHLLEQAPQDLLIQLLSHTRHDEGASGGGEPYELLTGGTVVERGLTDELGRVRVRRHDPATRRYQVRTSQGALYDIDLQEQLEAQAQQRARQGRRRPD